VTTVFTKDELVFGCEDSYEPLSGGRKVKGSGGRRFAGFCEDAHESRDAGKRWLGREGIVGFEPEKIATIAERSLGFEWESAEEFSAKLCVRSWFSDDECACSSNIDDVVVTQLFRELSWAKTSVSADVDASEEDNENHASL